MRDHVIQIGDVAVSVGNDGELNCGLRGFVYVGDPVSMGAEVIGALEIGVSREGVEAGGWAMYQADHLHASRVEFILEFGKGAEFRGADGCEVRGVAE